MSIFTMENKIIPYGKQNIIEEDINAVIDALQSDYLTQGPKIHEFELRFAEYVGSKYAVAVSNGTAALHLCTLALGVQEGDKVITTPITFAASANCVRYCGGEVVFSDIDPETYLLDFNKVKSLVENAPSGTYKGIIPVDFAGRAVDLEAFRKLADEYNLWIIEDACHAPGGFFVDSNGVSQNCGNSNFADLAIFSFHPVKHIATGEGGMITTNDDKLYKSLLKLRTHGITRNVSEFQNSIEFAAGTKEHNNEYPGWYMEMQKLGYNYRISDLQAALGISQLKRGESGLEKRIKIAKTYDEAFLNHKHIKSVLLELDESNKDKHAYHLYIIRTEKRLQLYNYLREHNIFCQIHYVPTHLMPYYRAFGWKEGDFPNAEAYYKECLSLPMYPTLSEDEQSYVIDKINEFFSK
jgi:UDP-4-amino-4,6-dideoxy-N-acetyl-beta-L-altrosamine transaminase